MSKRIIFIAAMLLMSAPLMAQQVNVAPDCVGRFNLTAAGTRSTIQNGTGCTTWLVSYKSNGFTAVTVEFDYAPDTNSQPSTFSIWPATPQLTNTTGGQLSATGTFYPWASVQLVSATGSGTVSGTFVGWRTAPTALLPATGATVPLTTVVTIPNPAFPLPPCNAVRRTGCK